MGNRVLRRSAMLRVATISSIAAMTFAGPAMATVYTGNGATGFGGPVGQGSLAVTDDAAGNVTFAFTPSAGHPSGAGREQSGHLHVDRCCRPDRHAVAH